MFSVGDKVQFTKNHTVQFTGASTQVFMGTFAKVIGVQDGAVQITFLDGLKIVLSNEEAASLVKRAFRANEISDCSSLLRFVDGSVPIFYEYEGTRWSLTGDSIIKTPRPEIRVRNAARELLRTNLYPARFLVPDNTALEIEMNAALQALKK